MNELNYFGRDKNDLSFRRIYVNDDAFFVVVIIFIMFILTCCGKGHAAANGEEMAAVPG